LRDGNVKEFNKQKPQGGKCDSPLAISDISISADSMRRGSTLAMLTFARRTCGIDFFKARLEGASINGARISGAFFPAELSADEIILSVEHGTRMRYAK